MPDSSSPANPSAGSEQLRLTNVKPPCPAKAPAYDENPERADYYRRRRGIPELDGGYLIFPDDPLRKSRAWS